MKTTTMTPLMTVLTCDKCGRVKPCRIVSEPYKPEDPTFAGIGVMVAICTECGGPESPMELSRA